jgi:hypothetical protein
MPLTAENYWSSVRACQRSRVVQDGYRTLAVHVLIGETVGQPVDAYRVEELGEVVFGSARVVVGSCEPLRGMEGNAPIKSGTEVCAQLKFGCRYAL